MKTSLKVIENEETVRLLIFRSLKDAKSFLEFTSIYYDESGCGNGYSAYRPSGFVIPIPFTNRAIAIPSIPLICFTRIDRRKNVLDLNFVRGMLYQILRVRFSVNEPDIDGFHLIVENTQSGIKFELEKLPEPCRPKVGEMYRIPRSKFFGDFPDVLDYSEGRVLEDLGDTLRVISSTEEYHRTAKPKTFLIKADRAIRINDSLTPLMKR
jgi:hypothetical protein